ncbi:MAG: TPM domain-containing protein [Chitinophagaceae bacterium]|jgi:uncharacterized protein|nr:TPM domain-containing protein [Chitinophagaceae bacterium]
MQIKKIFFLFIVVLCAAVATRAQDILPPPNPPRMVVDNAHLLSDVQQDILEKKLVAFNDSTSNQIAVVTLPTIGDNDIADYATKLLRKWGIGSKKNNNGILILVAADARKVWITTGYGLEGAIPDVMVSAIIQNDITPEFKQGNYYAGLDNAINSLSQAAAGEYHIAQNSTGGGQDLGAGAVFFIIIIIVIIVIFIGKGGGDGNMMSRRGSGNLGSFILGNIIGSMLSGGGRGWGGGSGGWGGSGGGGGFGGFGGGSSGGGGAGGSW